MRGSLAQAGSSPRTSQKTCPPRTVSQAPGYPLGPPCPLSDPLAEDLSYLSRMEVFLVPCFDMTQTQFMEIFC